MIGKYFLPVYVFSFHFIKGVFWSTKAFHFDAAQFITFFLYGVCFWCHYLRTLCLTQDSKCFAKFSGKSFTVLVNLDFLCMVWDKGLNSAFCIWVFDCHSTTCWKHDSFPINLLWHLCWKSVDYKCNSFIIWTLSSVLLILSLRQDHIIIFF